MVGGCLQLSKRVPSRINRLVFDVIAGLSPSGRLGSGGKSRIPCQQESATQLCRCASLTLPELEQSKTTILGADVCTFPSGLQTCHRNVHRLVLL